MPRAMLNLHAEITGLNFCIIPLKHKTTETNAPSYTNSSLSPYEHMGAQHQHISALHNSTIHQNPSSSTEHKAYWTTHRYVNWRTGKTTRECRRQ